MSNYFNAIKRLENFSTQSTIQNSIVFQRKKVSKALLDKKKRLNLYCTSMQNSVGNPFRRIKASKASSLFQHKEPSENLLDLYMCLKQKLKSCFHKPQNTIQTHFGVDKTTKFRHNNTSEKQCLKRLVTVNFQTLVQALKKYFRRKKPSKKL